MEVKIRRIHHPDLPLPTYKTAQAAGMDVIAAMDAPLLLQPGQRMLVDTGIQLALPEHTEAQIRPRSGLAYHHGVTVLNAPGTIDADYRGEIKVLLINLGQEAYTIQPGERIAQMVFATVEPAILTEVTELPATERADGGFGHTGKN